MKDLRNTGIIAIDMDDTLLRSDKTVSDYTVDVLQRAAAQGILIVPCSGRAYDGLPEELSRICGIRYAITLNGGVITQTDPRETVYVNALTMDEAHVVYDRLAAFGSPRTVSTEGPAFMLETERELIREYTPPYVVEYYYRTREFVPDALRSVEAAGHHPVKISGMIYRDGSNLAFAREQQLRFPEFSAVISCDALEVTAQGVTKGEGLRQLCRITGIPIDRTVAFGDSENDAAALEAAGTSVAMENGTPEIKAAADYVTRSNDEDGVAWFIENYILHDV